MSRKKIRKVIKSKRMFATGSSYSDDIILTSSYNEMSNSFAANSYLSLDGTNDAPLGGIVYMMNEMKEDIEDLHSEVSSSSYVSQINSGSMVSQVKTFTNRDTTPSVEGGSIFITNNDRPISITDFDDATPGQQITILIQDNNTSFTHNRSIMCLNGARSWTAAAAGDTISFTYYGTIWFETNRSDNT